jgi:hypothetical protein
VTPALAVVGRVLAFAVCLPLGPFGARVAAGLVLGLALAAVGVAGPPPGPSLPWPSLVAELGLGAVLGLLCGLPVHAARGLRASPEAAVTLGLAGRIWAWSVFFAVGGPGLLLDLFTTSFVHAPAGRWLAEGTLVELGALCFYGPLVLGLPLFLAALLVEPAAALVDRLVGAPIASPGAVGVRGLVGPLALLVAAPFLADELRGLLLHTLGVLRATS